MDGRRPPGPRPLGGFQEGARSLSLRPRQTKRRLRRGVPPVLCVKEGVSSTRPTGFPQDFHSILDALSFGGVSSNICCQFERIIPWRLKLTSHLQATGRQRQTQTPSEAGSSVKHKIALHAFLDVCFLQVFTQNVQLP